MTHYTNVKVRITEGQKVKLKKAFESNCKSITIRLAFSDLHGDDVIAITKSQRDRLVKACEEKKGMTIEMTKTQNEILNYSVVDIQIMANFTENVPANPRAFALVISDKMLSFQSYGNKM